MSPLSRGIRNTFRNVIRTVAIVLILSLSIGLSLTMLLAHKAVDQKIQSVKSSVGNTITISPAGLRGFEGGGNPLTQKQLSKVSTLPHVSTVTESLNDRLNSSNTNLKSSVSLGQFGQRFAERFDNGGSGGGPAIIGGHFNPANFTPPVTVIGTTDPTNLANTQGGGTFTLKSGQVFAGNNSEKVALVGTNLASKNNLSVGSAFSAYGTTIKVVGVFDSGNDFSNSLLIMPLSTLQTISKQTGDVSSAIATVDSIDNLDSVTQAVQSKLGSAADVTNSQQNQQNIISPLENVKTISMYSLIGAVVAGAIIILMTMIMIVRERRREIGVFKAIGSSNFKVVLQFVSEAITFTVLAAVIGIVIGVFASNPITNTLVKNSSSTNNGTGKTISTGGPGGGEGGLQFRFGSGQFSQNITNIHTSVGWSVIAYGLLAALIIAITGSTVATWIISKVKPAEVMRAE